MFTAKLRSSDHYNEIEHVSLVGLWVLDDRTVVVNVPNEVLFIGHIQLIETSTSSH